MIGCDRRSDAWSCGVCLFTMLTTMFPFAKADPSPEDGEVDWRLQLLQECEDDPGAFVLKLHAELRRECGDTR